MGAHPHRVLALYALIVFAVPLRAETGKDIVVNTFGGLNTNDDPASLADFESQDLLNVQLQRGMKSVFKRDGYGLFQTLPINTSTTAVHGGYHFQQLTGADVQLWGNDTEISGSVNDAAFVKLATGTVSATWQCTDNLGFAYCVDSLGDTPIRTDGTVANTSFLTANNFPLGTMIAATPSRLVIAGVSGNTSTLYFSQSNTLTNFVTGPLTTDPFTVIINSPGSRITHEGYFFGKVFWWKDQSFGYADCPNQYTCSITVVSNIIGTLDNSSAFWNGTTFETTNLFTSGAASYAGGLGGIFFRGQDNHIYVYDGYQLTRITRKITPTVTLANRKKANSFTQNNQAQFNLGTIVPGPNLSTTQLVGSVISSSFSAIENSSTPWNAGTTNNLLTISSNAFTVILTTAPFPNPDFEQNGGAGTAPSLWTLAGGAGGVNSSRVFTNCTLNPQHGSWMFNAGGSGSQNVTAAIWNASTNVGISTFTIGSGVCQTANCTWLRGTLSQGPNSGISAIIVLSNPSSNSSLTSTAFTLTGDIAIQYFCNGDAGSNTTLFDNFQYNVTTGTLLSQIYNTNFTSSTAQLQASVATFQTAPAFELQHSTLSGGPFVRIIPSTGTNAIVNQYVRYLSTITANAYDTSSSSVTSVTIISQATGTYYSQVNNAPNLSSWNTFTVTDNLPGASSITYYTRASTNNFVQTSSTPTWVLQPKNATVTASTGTFMQMRGDFSLTAATEAPSFSAFTFNWVEGSASDKMYITYFQDAIWFAGSSGTLSTNNFVLYLDLLNSYQWLQFNLPVNGFLVENNALYFGDPIQGRVFKFGGVQTDNGAAINSYWKSKDFSGDDPTIQNEYLQADFVFSVAQTTVTYTHLLDQAVSYSLNLPLTSPLNSLDVKRGFLLPAGKIGTFYNFKVGDNSSNPKWKMLMHRIHYNPLYWKPQTS